MDGDVEQRSVDMLTLQDGEGNFYMIPWEAVKLGRVPAEDAALLTQLRAGNADVSGFISNSDMNFLAGLFRVSSAPSELDRVKRSEAQHQQIMQNLARAAASQAAIMQSIAAMFRY